MPRITLQDLPWSTLTYQIGIKQCTPFIGAGASVDVMPLGGGLAERLLADDEASSRRPSPLSDRRDLARVCQYLAVTREDGGWPKRKIADAIGGSRPEGAPLPTVHQALARLNLPLYLTTNYDRLMSDAVAANGRNDVKVEYARWTQDLLEGDASAFDGGYVPTADRPAVFHLHGHFQQPMSMVCSEDDYVDFLVSISRDLSTSPTSPGQRTVLPLPVRSAIKNTTLLFIGYSLNDINFRVILRGLLGSLTRGARRISMAIQYSDNPGALEEWLQEYFRWSLDLQVYWGTASDFVATLRERIAQP